MVDLKATTDADLVDLIAQIKTEQNRRSEIGALQQDAKVAMEQLNLSVDSLEKLGGGSKFELLLSLLSEEFVDWLVVRGGTQKQAWRQPTDASTMYMVGDVVVYQGQNYRSLISQNSFSPAEAPTSWQLIP